jgi:hypothetical protein
VTAAAAQTPAACQAIVLGCTEYELAAELIRAAVPGAVTFGSADAVAAQALRRGPHRAQHRPATSEPDGAQLHNAHPDGGQLLDIHPDGGPPHNTHPDGGRLHNTHADGSHLDSGVSNGPRPNNVRLDSRQLGTVRVLLSGRPAPLPPAALRYPEGRLLAPLVRLEGADRQRVKGQAVPR